MEEDSGSNRRLGSDRPSGLNFVRPPFVLLGYLLTHESVALGVGKKAAGGTISSGPSSDRGGPTIIGSARPKANPVQTTAKSASASTGVSMSPSRSFGLSETVVGSSHSVGRMSQSSSALKGLMEQGWSVKW